MLFIDLLLGNILHEGQKNGMSLQNFAWAYPTWLPTWKKYGKNVWGNNLQFSLCTMETMSHKQCPKNLCTNFECYDLTNGEDPTVGISHGSTDSRWVWDLTVESTEKQ